MAGKKGQKKRFWSDEEKISICVQTCAPGVSVAQIARRYAMNANLIHKWLRDPKCAPELQGTEEQTTLEPCFLPVEVVDRPVTADPAPTPVANATSGHSAIEINIAGGQLPSISGKSPLAGAIRYALTRMARLRPYLDHGVLELDNNTAERAIQSIAIGRKNYLFVGSQTSGRTAAIAYTLIETAKRIGVDPQAWRADTLARIPDCKINRADDLLPWKSAS